MLTCKEMVSIYLQRQRERERLGENKESFCVIEGEKARDREIPQIESMREGNDLDRGKNTFRF